MTTIARAHERPSALRRGFNVRVTQLSEWSTLCALLVLVFITYLWRLDAVIIADMDEGTYLYAGKLIARGDLPYRDFMLAHPPLIAYLTGAWIAIAGTSIDAARIAYAALVLLTTIPLYLIARSITGSRLAALFGIASYTTGMLLLANMGRTIRIEPVMNAALIAGFGALLFARSRAWLVLAGTLFGAAVLVKLVAIVPAGLLVLGDLISDRQRAPQRWAFVCIGAAAVLVPSTILLLLQPRFVDDVIVLQLARPGLPLSVRLSFVAQDFVRDPLIPAALASAVWWLARGRDIRLRAISLVAIGSCLALVVLFRTFFGYYLVEALPWLSVALAASVAAILRRAPSARVARAVAVATIVLAAVVPLAYAEAYYRTAHDHVSSAAPIVTALRSASGPVYSMYPSFALWSGREACGSYDVADSLIGRVTGRLRDDDFVALFGGCAALVLYRGELDQYPKAQASVERSFKVTIANADYTLWTKR